MLKKIAMLTLVCFLTFILSATALAADPVVLPGGLTVTAPSEYSYSHEEENAYGWITTENGRFQMFQIVIMDMSEYSGIFPDILSAMFDLVSTDKVDELFLQAFESAGASNITSCTIGGKKCYIGDMDYSGIPCVAFSMYIGNTMYIGLFMDLTDTSQSKTILEEEIVSNWLSFAESTQGK